MMNISELSNVNDWTQLTSRDLVALHVSDYMVSLMAKFQNQTLKGTCEICQPTIDSQPANKN
jgi:hypothetical protein